MSESKAGGIADDELRPLDLVTLGGVLKVCEVEMVLLDNAGPRAAITSRVHDGVLLCTAETGFRFRGRFMLPLDWCLLGFVHQTGDAGSWCHGTPLECGAVVTVLPEGISEFALSAGTRVTFMLVPLKRFEQKFSELNLGRMTPPGNSASLFRAGEWQEARELQQLCEHVRQRLVSSADMSGVQETSIGEAYLHKHLQAMLSASGSDRPTCSRGRHTHYLILQRAENFMRSNLRRNIYMHEICNAAGVSERALRYAFDNLLGISPNRYLSMLRLCSACRSLSMTDASRRSVKSIALSYGLWDLSRFADNYRRIFGELPRETLLRAPSNGIEAG